MAVKNTSRNSRVCRLVGSEGHGMARVVVPDLLSFADSPAVRDVSQERYGGCCGGESG
jgi:hypothetical protein